MEEQPQLTEEVRKQLLANFVLGTQVKVPESYGHAEHDDFMDSAPMPELYPEDAP